METPASSRRVTRSQTLASSANGSNLLLSKKVEESEKTMTTSRKNQQQDRSALIDITNDSPIVGLAMGNLKTPLSAMSKKRVSNGFARTPGSGEALLRGQVKTLLQKVEEEAEISKITLEKRPFFNLQGLVNNTPMNLVAPTPANTPHVLNLSADNDDMPSVTPVTDKFLIPQMMIEKKQEMDECESVITRSLLLDFSEKSDSYDCSSVLTKDEDDASVWSLQVNASSTRDEDEEEDYEDSLEEEEDDDDDEYYYYDEGGDNLDDLCEEMSKISVEESRFMGKHIRFVYNSDDEIEKEQVLGVLRLKGLPTPKGKHLRFPETS